MIWSNVITAFLCGCIAADGTIWEHKGIRVNKTKPNKRIKRSRIIILYSNEKQRIDEVHEHLRNNAIHVTKGEKRQKPNKIMPRHYIQYLVRLSEKNSQHYTFYNSIKTHNLEWMLGSRKFEKLEKILYPNNQTKIVDEIKEMRK